MSNARAYFSWSVVVSSLLAVQPDFVWSKVGTNAHLAAPGRMIEQAISQPELCFTHLKLVNGNAQSIGAQLKAFEARTAGSSDIVIPVVSGRNGSSKIVPLRFVPAETLYNDRGLWRTVLNMLDEGLLDATDAFGPRAKRLLGELTLEDQEALSRWRMVLSPDQSVLGLIFVAPYVGYLAIYTTELGRYEIPLLEEACQLQGLSELLVDRWSDRRVPGGLIVENIPVGKQMITETVLHELEALNAIGRFPSRLVSELEAGSSVAPRSDSEWKRPRSGWVIHDQFGPGRVGYKGFKNDLAPILFIGNGRTYRLQRSDVRALLVGSEVTERLMGLTGMTPVATRTIVDDWVPDDFRTGNAHYYDEGRLTEIQTFVTSPDRLWLPGTRKICDAFGLGEIQKPLVSIVKKHVRTLRFLDGKTRNIPEGDLRRTLRLADLAAESSLDSGSIRRVLKANDVRPAYYRRNRRGSTHEWDERVLAILPELLKDQKKNRTFQPRPDVVAKAKIYMIPVSAQAEEAARPKRVGGRQVLHEKRGLGDVLNGSLLLPGKKGEMVPAAEVRFQDKPKPVIVPWSDLRRILSFKELLKELNRDGNVLPRFTLLKAFKRGLFNDVTRRANRDRIAEYGFDEAIVPELRKIFFESKAEDFKPDAVIISDLYGQGRVERAVVAPQPEAKAELIVWFFDRKAHLQVPMDEVRHLYTGKEFARLISDETGRSVDFLAKEIISRVPYDLKSSGHYYYDERRRAQVIQWVLQPDRRWLPGARNVHPEKGLGTLIKQSYKLWEKGKVLMKFQGKGKPITARRDQLREAIPLRELIRRLAPKYGFSEKGFYVFSKLLAINHIRPVYHAGDRRNSPHEFDSIVLQVMDELLSIPRLPRRPHVARPDIVRKYTIHMVSA